MNAQWAKEREALLKAQLAELRARLLDERGGAVSGRDAAGDKEIVVSNLKKEIENLEQKIKDMEAQWAEERETLQDDAGNAIEKQKEMMKTAHQEKLDALGDDR